MKYVIASGYFNPIHVGHVEYLELAKELGDKLYVIVNSDHQAELKRGIPSFMPEQDRQSIVQGLKSVDGTMVSIDQDLSVCESIKELWMELKRDEGAEEFVFAKGGDRFSNEIPEAIVCKELDIEIVDGLGDKIRNSSDFVK
jgi:cytidyltransferase-like protein